jgi:hypothetical protein
VKSIKLLPELKENTSAGDEELVRNVIIEVSSTGPTQGKCFSVSG